MVGWPMKRKDSEENGCHLTEELSCHLPMIGLYMLAQVTCYSYSVKMYQLETTYELDSLYEI
jgi:hypothetical protein